MLGLGRFLAFVERLSPSFFDTLRQVLTRWKVEGLTIGKCVHAQTESLISV